LVATAIKSLFGAGGGQDEAITQLEKLRASISMVRALFRNPDSTEFIIATIPTFLGVNESGRLLRALRKDAIPCHRIVVNQVPHASQDPCQAIH
jgi:arsenite/tail-anchored protein-transporting ATPase